MHHIKSRMQRLARRVTSRRAQLVALVAGPVALGAAGSASATTTYDISPVTTSITGELAGNLPVILGIMGGLIALGIAVKAVRKFAHV